MAMAGDDGVATITVTPGKTGTVGSGNTGTAGGSVTSSAAGQARLPNVGTAYNKTNFTFTEKKLNFEIILGTGDFGQGTGQSVLLEGHQADIQIQKMAQGWGDALTGRIFGVPFNIMNALCTLGKTRLTMRQNFIRVYAGDDESGMTMVFSGVLTTANVNFASAPEVSLDINALTNALLNVRPHIPVQWSGGVDVVTILASFASFAALTFENSGVQGIMLRDVYLWGSWHDQVREVCEMANIDWYLDGITLAIWPKWGRRNGEVVLVDKDHGLVGYPGFGDASISFVMLYSPNMIFGRMVNLQSVLPAACGLWYVRSLNYALTARVADGPWFITVEAFRWNDEGQDTTQLPDGTQVTTPQYGAS
jgi:hypothetical protein